MNEKRKETARLANTPLHRDLTRIVFFFFFTTWLKRIESGPHAHEQQPKQGRECLVFRQKEREKGGISVVVFFYFFFLPFP
jgi:hypothetical protein